MLHTVPGNCWILLDTAALLLACFSESERQQLMPAVYMLMYEAVESYAVGLYAFSG